MSTSGFTTTINNNINKYHFKFVGTFFPRETLKWVRVAYELPTPSPTNKYLNVPPAGFVPYSETADTVISDSKLENKGTTTNRHMQAPILLPDGASLGKITFACYDTSIPDNISAHLHRTDLAGSWPAIIDLVSSGYPGLMQVEASPVPTKIDNRKYAYWVYVDLPKATASPPPTHAVGFKIQYWLDPAHEVHPVQWISVPAAVFTPRSDGQVYENHGRFLKSYGNQIFVAPLYLPHGKYIRSLKLFYHRTGNPPDGYADLKIYDEASGGTTVKTIIADSGTGWTSKVFKTFGRTKIDNSAKTYWLELWLYGVYTDEEHIMPSGIVVEVADGDFQSFLPIVRR